MSTVRIAIAGIVAFVAVLLTSAGGKQPLRETIVTALVYPPMARATRVTATATVRVEVTADGSVSSVQVVAFESNAKEPGAKGVFADAILNNLREWRFEPAVDGAAKRETRIQYVFRLEGEPDPCPQTRVTFELPDKVEVTAAPSAAFSSGGAR